MISNSLQNQMQQYVCGGLGVLYLYEH